MFLGHFPAFQYRDYRLLWCSEFFSATGTTILNVAINWQLYQLTHSAFALGLSGLFQFLPFILFNLVGGNVADAVNRKKILYFTQPVIAGCSLLLALATYMGRISPLLIYLSIAVVGLVVAFDLPARTALMPSLVKNEHLISANSLYEILWQIASMIGPAIGGFLIAYIGLGPIYLLDAFSTLFVFVAILFMHASGQPEGQPAPMHISSVFEGFKFLFSKPLLWSVRVLDLFSVLFASCVILLPIYAIDILHVGPQGLGLLYAAPAAGSVVFGLLATPLLMRIHHHGYILLSATAIYAIAIIVFGFSQNFFLSIIALAITGGADITAMIIRSTISQLLTPDGMRGRLASINSFFWLGGDKLGDMEAGMLAQFIGAPLSVAAGGFIALFVVFGMAIGNKPFAR